jgi:Hypervirulence associated proteins TUDOR domain
MVTDEEQVASEGHKGKEVRGSEEDPRYVVESDKTGQQAAHKPESLEKK